MKRFNTCVCVTCVCVCVCVCVFARACERAFFFTNCEYLVFLIYTLFLNKFVINYLFNSSLSFDVPYQNPLPLQNFQAFFAYIC